MRFKFLVTCSTYLIVFIATTLLTACHSLINSKYSHTLPIEQGMISVQGISDNVTIRRNSLGIPLISTNNLEDAYFAWGYAHAADRINYMVMMRLTAQGRLAEFLGESALDVDRFMRVLNFTDKAQKLYNQSSPETKQLFESYTKGVNAWLTANRANLPMDLSSADYQPELWKAEDSVVIFCLSNFGLSGNLHEEIASLVVAQKLDLDKLAWLFPIYQDEPIPFTETEKLKGLNLKTILPDLTALQKASLNLQHLHLANVVASNNWAIAPLLTKQGASLLANDAHLPIGMPSLWSYVHINTPKYQTAGASVAGIPAIIIGANRNLGWGMTMVMADNEDLFLEKLQEKQGKLYYLAKDKWIETKERIETYNIKGKPSITEIIHETAHGPLLNKALENRQYPLQPQAIQLNYGIALQTPFINTQDKTIDAIVNLATAQSVEQALPIAKQIRALAVNLLFADKDHIGWQLTGQYPLRKKGLGLIPSPGWSGEYDWQDEVSIEQHPSVFQPTNNWLATANNRVVDKDYPVIFSSSFSHSERAERIEQLISKSSVHDFQNMRTMQYDQVNLLAVKLQPYWQTPELNQAIAQLPSEQKQLAEKARQRLANFKGDMDKNSADAALFSLFLHQFPYQLFADELKIDSKAWQAIVEMATKSYSPHVDHLLGQEQSPFWNNINTTTHETKATIMAQTLAAAYQAGEQQLGKNYNNWQWGKLHTYKWNSLPAQIAHYLPAKQQKFIKRLDSYLNRGPYPAGGDFNTIDIASYAWGSSFQTALIPSLRMIVDFSQTEHLWIMNSTGQSANPASKHYADNIESWLKGQYTNIPLDPKHFDTSYSKKTLTLMPQETPYAN